MSGEPSKNCTECGHEEKNHNVLREPYGRLCGQCVDEKNIDPCRKFSS